MTLLAQRISPAGREVNFQGGTHLFRLSNTFNTYHSSPDRDKWRVPVYWTTQYPGLIQHSHSNVFKLSKRYLFLDYIKYRKTFQGPQVFAALFYAVSPFPSRVKRVAWICIRISIFFHPFCLEKHAINSSSESNSFCGDWFGRIDSAAWI